MKQNFLIVSVMFCSLVSGGLGAYLFSYHEKQKSAQIETLTTQNTSQAEEQEDNAVIEAPLSQMESLEQSITQIAESSAESIVSIVIKKDLVIYRSDPWGFFQQPTGTVTREVGGGSGFFIKKDGTILTNKHVVSDSDAEYTVILSNGEEHDALVIASDPVNDLAIIKIHSENNNFPVLDIANSTDDIQIGSFAIAVGNALAEFQNSVSLGIVSGKGRSIQASGDTLSGLIQTDAAINPGNSGGPLINTAGEIIGINTAIASGSTGIGFAYALTQQRIDYMLESIETSGRIMRPFIGISYIPNSPGIASQLGLASELGAYIIDEAGSISPGSSAEESGLEPGDIILSINDQDIGNKISLSSIIQNSLPGDMLELEVLKKSGENVTLELTLGAY